MIEMVTAMSPQDLRKDKDKTSDVFIAVLYHKGRTVNSTTSLGHHS